MLGSRDRCSSACASTAGSARVRPSTGAGRSIDRLQRVEAGEIELGGAPLQHLDRVEVMRLDLLDQFLVERIDLAGDAEGAVAQMTAGAAGDLPQFGRR